MASNKFVTLIFIFVSLVASPIAHAQLSLGGLLGNGGLGGLLGGTGLGGLLGGGGGGGLGGFLGGGGSGGGGGLLGLIHINGNVSCSLDGSSGVATPAFPNAVVQLQCGGNVVSSTTTNANGVFSMVLTPVQNILSLVNGCNMVVKTPLSTCNANLPSGGGLVSGILSLGSTLLGLLNITTLVPDVFKFVPNI